MKKQQQYILLVDDNEDDIDLTLRALQQGHLTNHVEVVRDGQEALDYLFSEGEYADQHHDLPVVVLLDLNMPRLGGLDALKRIRAEPTTELLPVVILTTSDEQRDVIQSYQLGANSFVQKPVTTETMSAKRGRPFASQSSVAGPSWRDGP